MMQPTSEGCMNIAELANQLRREKIFINSERQLIQNLNEEVEKTVLELLQAAWICSQQRQNLNNLISSRSEADSIAACQRASLLEATSFVDAQKVLKYKEVQALGELLGWLRNTPNLMALCLLLGEDHMPASLPSSLAAGLYGSCRSPADRTRLLAVIRALIKYQMAPSSDPRKVLRSNRSALSSLYAVFRDNHAPARQFLIAVLRAPVLAVLTEDEFFLDLDPDKALERFTPADRAKKFGQPNTTEYNAKVARYRKWTVQSLYNLTSKFIASLKENWATFPSSIAWIVQQVVHLLKQNSRSTERDIHAMCTELVLGQLVCPAIVSPEAHGLLAAPVSYIARFNLVQVAQILQMLSLARYQEVEPKVRDLYAKFERSCVWSLVEGVAGEQLAPAPPLPPTDTAPPTDAPPPAALALYTAHDAHLLIAYLRRISSKLNNNNQNGNGDSSNGPAENAVDTAFGSFPSPPAEEVGGAGEGGAGPAGVAGSGCARLEALVANNDPNYRSRLHDLLRKMPDFAALRPSPPEGRGSGLGLGRRRREEREERAREDLEVLLVRLRDAHDHDYVGLVPEAKVLECYYGEAEAEDAVALVAAAAPAQKRTRFSVSHDEVSLGNTSDNLEAVSEAASNHSVTSSLELETEDQNDNLSDMVSANVSGRGSPNISGRETPSSQVTDGDPAGDHALRRIQANAPANQAVSAAHAKMLKQARNDIEDKFCKFEIKKLLEGDETISIMSDTWSTDVLASDSETIGDSCDTAQPAASHGSNTNTIAPDVSETASESAWSVDVLASDSDRNTEVDTDDCVSVAARSDTSWPRRASHHDDLARSHLQQNGTVKRADLGSPRHSSRAQLPNRSGGYLSARSATAALHRGGELDLPARCDHRKSILVNGYPVMTCYASAPESPSTAPALPSDVFDYPHDGPSEGVACAGGGAGAGGAAGSLASGSGGSGGAPSAGAGSDATSQWVDDSFPDKYLPSTSKGYDDNDMMDRSLNSSESSFNAMSASQYERRFDTAAEAERRGPERTFADLVTRMSAATITSNIASISRIAKSEIRTSIVNISSSRVEKKRETSNISLSTLSVNSENSVSDKSSSQDVNSENVTERRVSPPPKNSTGAIPKSISFDATAEKSQRRRILGEEGLAGNLDELKNNVKRSGGSLLHRIKMFRHKGRSHHGDMKVSTEEVVPDESREPGGESSEEILAKYRRAADTAPRRLRHDAPPTTQALTTHDLDRCEGVVDLNDPEVFNNMKRRLRIVLSNIDFHCVDYVPNRCTSTSLAEWCRAGSSAECAAVSRALAGAGGGARAARLAAALRADLAARRPYAAYLASCRASLAHALYILQSEVKAVRREWERWARAAAAARVTEQLERGPALRRPPAHAAHHAHALLHGGELIDERATRLTASIKAITAEIKADPSWDGASTTILESVEETVERAVYAKLYLHVLFPNGDGDIARDQVFSEHIRRAVSAGGGARLGVAARHLWAAPFAHAQQQLRALPAHRAPLDKLRCVLRCVRSLLATLALSAPDPPAADDLTPALVYVILKVNPPSLLSTLELVNALAGPALHGEALYWWTQFCAAVAYIKTMDYPPSPPTAQAPPTAPAPPPAHDS